MVNYREMRDHLKDLAERFFTVNNECKILYNSVMVLSFILTTTISICLFAAGIFKERVTLDDHSGSTIELKLHISGFLGLSTLLYSIIGCYLACCARRLDGKVSRSY